MNSKSRSPRRIYFLFAFTCFVAFTLMLVQVPDWLASFWPDWMALILVYWALYTPSRVGPITGFVVGTMLEVLFAKTFGVLSLGMAALAFMVNLSHLQLRVTSRWQQVFLVVLFVAIFKLVNLWLEGMVDGAKITASDWYSLLGNFLIWPFVNIALDELRRAFRIR